MKVSPKVLEHDARRRGLHFRVLAGVKKYAVTQPSGTVTRCATLEEADTLIGLYPVKAVYRSF